LIITISSTCFGR